MLFAKSKKYDQNFVRDNMMGPNALKIIEELTQTMKLQPGMRVLDLGCGRGLTSIFLAQEFGVQVYATDLWIEAQENEQRFRQLSLEKKITAIHADANALPFEQDFFDAIISVDAYLYFGLQAGFMEEKLAPLLKAAGEIALAFPGFKRELSLPLPPEFLLSWKEEDLEPFHSCGWWQALLAGAPSIELQAVTEMECCEESWQDWLQCENPYAVNDRLAMSAGAGVYMNMIAVRAKKQA